MIVVAIRIHKKHITAMGTEWGALTVVVSQMYYDPAQQYETAQEPQVEQAVEVMA